MAEYLPIYKRINREQSLDVGQSISINFSPKPGMTTVEVTMSGAFIKYEPELPPALIRKFEITFICSGQVFAQKTVSLVNKSSKRDKGNFGFDIPLAESGKTWTCRVKHLIQHPMFGTTAVSCSVKLAFPKKLHTLVSTTIPYRVLQNGLHQVIDALGLAVYLDGTNSYVDFSDELKAFSNGQLKRIPLPFDAKVRDMSMKSIDVKAIEVKTFGDPGFMVAIDFETSGIEFSKTFLSFFSWIVDFTKAAIKIFIHLKTSNGSPLSRFIQPVFEVDLDFDGRLDGVVGDLIEEYVGTLREIADDFEDNLNQTLNASIVPKIVGEYLTEALTRLATRNHIFYEIKANRNGFVIKHFDQRVEADPNDKPEVPGKIDLSPPPIPIGEQLESPINLDQVEHIVVLMQENRSFDHMLGYLSIDGNRNDVNGLTGNESNPIPGLPKVPVTRLLPSDVAIPFGPAHDFSEVLKQIADGSMSGFAESFNRRFPGADERLVMGYFDRALVPTFDLLAKNYLICNNWFSSFPGGTQPNRFCTLSGFSPTLDNYDFGEPQLGYLDIPSLFDRLTLHGVSWVYYEHDVAFLRFYDRYRLESKKIIPFDDPQEGFIVKAKQGKLPKVTFIDPNFVDVPPLSTASDDHPPADITLGQNLVARIHDALVNSPKWKKTLFIITYDEHGGFYDHVPPPGSAESEVVRKISKVHPDAPAMFGPRVPAFLISPLVEKRSVSNLIFDHTSIYKTIILKFLGPEYLRLMPPRVREATQIGLALKPGPAREDKFTFGIIDKPKLKRVPLKERPKPERDDHHEGVRRLGLPNKDF
jgi:phospholipase C